MPRARPGRGRGVYSRNMPEETSILLRMRGRVQGVGFRPAVFRLAQQHAPELPPSNTRQESDDDRASLPRLESQLESRLESKLAAKIVLQLGTQPSGKAELARALGHTTVSGELHKQIRRLLDLSLVEMTIPDKPQSRLQRYRLTQTGRQLFDPIEGKTT